MYKILKVLVVLLVLFSSSYAKDLEKISLQLQWKYQFQFAGFIVAKEKGYYEDIGLDVKILEYENTNSMQDLIDGKIDFAINNSIVVYDNKKLQNVTLLATYFQRSPLIIITQPDIKNILDLKGRSIMISKNDIYNSSISMMFNHFLIDKTNTTFLKQSFLLDDFISKKVDAMVAFKSNEIFELNKKGINYNILDPVEYGFSTNAINLFASHNMVQNRPKLIDKFLQANKKGWEYALNHIDEVAALIHNKYNNNKSIELLKYEGQITKELMLLDFYEIGEINKEFVNLTCRQLIKSKEIDENQDQDKLIYVKKQESEKSLKLSVKEKQWIRNHPVIRYSEVDWKPLSIIRNNKMYGIMGEYLDKVSELTGINFKFIPSSSWLNVLEQFKAKKIDIVPGIGASPQEIKLGILSDTFASYPMVIVTGQEYSYLDSLKNLKDKIIAVPKYYTSYNFIVNKYPKIRLITTSTIEEALVMVESGEADAFVGHITPTLHYISKLNLDNLKVSGTTTFKFNHHYLIQHEDKVLKSIINKAFKAITEQEKNKINSNWITIRVDKKIDKRWIIFILILFAFVVFVFMLRHLILRKSNKELQDMKNLFELSVDSGKIGIWDWDLITNHVYFSDSWLNMLGFKKNELSYTMKSWRRQIHPDDLKKTMQYFKKTIRNNEEYAQGTHRLKKKDGSYIWILFNTRMFFDNKNKAIRILGTHIDITKEKTMQEELTKQKDILRYQAHHDALTNLPNRTLFQDRLEQGIAQCKRNSDKLALFFIDLDHFKEINDSLGHEVGDKILVEVSKRISCVIRDEDTLARLGGDEFTVIMKNLKEAQNASLSAQKIIESLNEPIEIDDHILYVSCSIGISLFPNDGESSQNLLKYADAAMYKAKDEGRSNFQFYSSEMTEMAFERVVMEASLREALKNKEFVVYYQPQVDAKNNKIIGMEALVRWNHPTMGLVSPAKFIPLAEVTGLIVQLDQYVMQNSITQFIKWYKDGLNPGVLSINLSVKQLEQDTCISTLKMMLKNLACKSEWLELEVTEGQIMKNPEDAIITLTEISKLGINLSIDDFGTGYSSLSYLKKFPISKLKIDQSFVRDLPNDEEDSAITKAVIALGNSLNLTLIAEGVETKEQRDFLLENGCNNIQGYFYAKPMPANEMKIFIQNGL